MGHLLDNLLTLLDLLEAPSPVVASELAAYRRDAEPIRSGESAGLRELDWLLDGHEKAHAALVQRLSELDEAFFRREVQQNGRQVKLSWRFLFLHFHHTYHLGQLEFLRQLAGRTEKLI